jgi:diadenosine tetraphosphate (Ap4A) HIT family hydrolase
VPEHPEELWERARDALRMPPVEGWETFPFEGDLRPRALAPPEAEERPRRGEGGVDCWRCERGDESAVWADERWIVSSLGRPTGLPVIVLLEPRTHYADPGDLPQDVAAELGIMLARVERAVRSIGEIGRVHVCRWGDGSEHLHWWFMGRPARIPQLTGSFAAIWDDILPPTPNDLWQANLDAVARALTAQK